MDVREVHVIPQRGMAFPNGTKESEALEKGASNLKKGQNVAVATKAQDGFAARLQVVVSSSRGYEKKRTFGSPTPKIQTFVDRGYEREAVFTKVKGKVFQLRGGFVLARFGGEQDNRRASGGNFPATRGDERVPQGKVNSTALTGRKS